MAEDNLIVQAMIDGYGKDFSGLEALFTLEVSEEDISELLSPIPELGRYRKHVKFLENVTSGAAYGKLRFRVMTEYDIALGIFFDENAVLGAIVEHVMEEEERNLRKIGLYLEDIVYNPSRNHRGIFDSNK